MIPLRKMTPEEYAEVNLIGTERVPNRGVEGNQALVQALGDKLREIVDENAEVQNENNENIYTKAEVDGKDSATLNLAKDYTDEKVVDIGAADMVKAVYDPRRISEDIFSVSYMAMLPYAEWSENAPYTQTIQIEGLRKTDRPFIDVVLSEDTKTAKKELAAWGNVYRIDTNTDAITARCLGKPPRVDLNIEIRVVK